MSDEKLVYPHDWEDDMKMTVMFSPFRDRNLNPKSWDQKVKFWSGVLINNCMNCGKSLVTVPDLKEQFRRKGKSPACLETVIQELLRNGQLKKLSDMTRVNPSGWLSWGYKKLVTDPIGWSLKMFTQPQTGVDVEENFVVIDVIKAKANTLVESRNRTTAEANSDIIDYDDLRDQHRELCPSDNEFAFVMQELCALRKVVIQETDNNTKLVKFAAKDGKNLPVKITDQDIQIHKIRHAHSTVQKQIAMLSENVTELASEAVSYKTQGLMKLAMGAMRKRKLAQIRIEKLTGSLDMLEDILYRIAQAESNDMILRAIEGGSGALKDLQGRTTVDEVSNIMDDLADVTQDQDELASNLSTLFPVEEPSQTDLEQELTDMFKDTSEMPPVPVSFRSKLEVDDDEDIERELAEILKDGGNTSLSDMLDDLQLPDVPGQSPSQVAPDRKKAKLLTS